MKEKIKRILLQLSPFLILGVVIAILVGLLVMFSYVILWGLLIGACIWLVVLIKMQFFPSYPTQPVKVSRKKPRKGRIIDQDKSDK